MQDVKANVPAQDGKTEASARDLETNVSASPDALIMSAKFAPGHFSHMLAFYRLFEASGFRAALYLQKQYRPFADSAPEYRALTLDAPGVPAPDILLIYNLSMSDMKYIRRFRRENPSMRVWFVYHEPWEGFRAWAAQLFQSRESIGERVRTLGRYVFVRPVLRQTETVLLPSGEALSCYRERFARLYPQVRARMFPLVFTDEAEGMSVTSPDNETQENSVAPPERKYFSFIATATRQHGFDLFLNYVRHKADDPDALFRIDTRSDITRALRDDVLQRLIREKRLLIRQGRPLSNAEINAAYASSACAWLFYRHSFQSGVLCKAMMFGSPVLASDTGSFREFVTRDNGVLLPVGAGNDEIDRAYETIRNRQREMSQAARETWLRRFDCRAQTDAFQEIIRG